jgi:hypothetical protein
MTISTQGMKKRSKSSILEEIITEAIKLLLSSARIALNALILMLLFNTLLTWAFPLDDINYLQSMVLTGTLQVLKTHEII